jgi:membrane fusion protein (multidrug efflux system)
MIIPQKSTYEVQNKIFVYVYDEKSHQVKSVSIEPKFRLPHIYVIEPNSLNLTDKIVYEGIQDLRDSTKIEANFTELKQLLVEFNQ